MGAPPQISVQRLCSARVPGLGADLLPQLLSGPAQVLQVHGNGDLANFYDIPGLFAHCGRRAGRGRQALHVQRHHGLLVEPSTGDPLARLELGDFKEHFLVPRLNGGVLLAHADGVQALDADLKTVGRWLPGFKAARVRDLPGGWLRHGASL